MIDKVGQETLEIMSTVSWYNNLLYDRIKMNLAGDILEVGAGIGNFTPLLAKRGSVYAIDINKSYIKNLKKELPRSVKVGYGDIESGEFEFNNKKFDCIVCMNVLEHIKNHRSALKNMEKLLRKNGRVILLVPAFSFAYGEFDKNLGHFRRYEISELKSILASENFSVEHASYLNMLGLLGWAGNRLLKRRVIPRYQLLVFSLIARPMMFIEKFIKPRFGLSALIVGSKK